MPMKWNKQNKEVFYPNQHEFLGIAKNDIDYLAKLAQQNSRNRARYCTHSSVDDAVHEMIIYHEKGTYIRPHKHISKTESFHLVEGEAEVLIFDEEGNLTHFKELGEYECGKCFYYRIPESCFHAQIFRQNTVFHESTKGPFTINETIYPDWAPEEHENGLVKEYMKKINFQKKHLLIENG